MLSVLLIFISLFFTGFVSGIVMANIWQLLKKGL